MLCTHSRASCMYSDYLFWFRIFSLHHYVALVCNYLAFDRAFRRVDCSMKGVHCVFDGKPMCDERFQVDQPARNEPYSFRVLIGVAVLELEVDLVG